MFCSTHLQVVEVAVDVEEELSVGDEGELVAQPRESVADVVEGGRPLHPRVGEVGVPRRLRRRCDVVFGGGGSLVLLRVHVQVVILKELFEVDL